MKTIIKTQCAALIGLTLLFFSCEKEVLEISKSTATQEAITAIESTDATSLQQKGFGYFDFDILVTDCTRTGKTLEAVMHTFEGFLLSWKLDGKYAGPKAQLLCVHANSATLIVTRRADGLSLTKTINLYNGADINSFDFELVKSECFASGTTLEARTQLDALSYSYLWEIDASPAGHSRQIDCVCGHVAKIRVTRLSDGAMLTKSAKLTPCGADQ
jgi:hypothetical protein